MITDKIFRLSALALALTIFFIEPALAWPRTLHGFNGYQFFEVDRNQRGGFTMVPDPIDPNNTKKVYKFSIRPEKCVGKECHQQSVRSSIQQGPDAKQPKTAWYGWDMYFPPDFPNDGVQRLGLQQFNEWKDQNQCGLVSLAVDPNQGGRDLLWVMQKPTGKPETQFGGDCVPVMRISIAKISDLVGSWHRFEVFAHWTTEGDGQFKVYIDGKQKVDYTGVTCFNCDKMNYFSFGNYLCCTESSEKIQPSTVYYRFLSRSKSRQELKWR